MRRWSFMLIGLCIAGATHAQPYVNGFVEGIQVFRIQPNSALDSSRSFREWTYPRSEVRAQLQLSGGGERDEYFVRMDVVADRLRENVTYVELREAYLKLYPADWTDLKFGRQVATWGTGDLLFVNDLFARNWVAFFTGLDVQYLKLPQDLLRAAFYLGAPTLEIALSPTYTMSRIPDGSRLSFYNPITGERSDDPPPVRLPSASLENGEFYGRFYGLAGGTEWALYGYRGFYPQPTSVAVQGSTAVLYPSRLTSGGASLRGSWSSFLLNGEGALYYSNADPHGSNPSIPNSSVRLLAGAERGLGHEWTASVQWLGDWMLDYADYRAPFDSAGTDPMYAELRNTVTLRLTKFLRNQTLHWTLFAYWGITDEDVYIRTYGDYKITDAVQLTLGLNWLDGNKPYTTIGQFQNNSNVYGRIRYSF